MASIGICRFEGEKKCHGINRETRECPDGVCGVHGMEYTRLWVLDSDFDDWSREFSLDSVRKKGLGTDETINKVGQLVAQMTR